MKQIYHYDQQSCFFCCTGEADPSPLENGVWLVPANATTVEPPVIPEGMAARWNGDSWSLESLPIQQDQISVPEQDNIDPILLCKAKAKQLLQETDWSQLSDVAISNKAAFDAYRSAVRAIYFSPVIEPVWPERPEAAWL